MPEELTEDQCAGGKVEGDGEVGRSLYQVLNTLLGLVFVLRLTGGLSV